MMEIELQFSISCVLLKEQCVLAVHQRILPTLALPRTKKTWGSVKFLASGLRFARFVSYRMPFRTRLKTCLFQFAYPS